MQPQHTNPADAVQIHQDVRSKKSIGIHCCTFNLTTGERNQSISCFRVLCSFVSGTAEIG
jgi:hypothetical protein